MNTILCAVDGSRSAEAALDHAIGLARNSGASLALIAVRLRPIPARGGSIPMLPVEDHAGVRRVVDDAAEKAREAGITTYAVVAFGNPAEEIAAEAVRRGVDLVVVGSRGLGPVSGALLGSVSTDVIRRSPVPVTVVAHAR